MTDERIPVPSHLEPLAVRQRVGERDAGGVLRAPRHVVAELQAAAGPRLLPAAPPAADAKSQRRREITKERWATRNLQRSALDERRLGIKRDAAARRDRIAGVLLAVERLYAAYGRYIEVLDTSHATDTIVDGAYREVLQAHAALERAQGGAR